MQGLLLLRMANSVPIRILRLRIRLVLHSQSVVAMSPIALLLLLLLLHVVLVMVLLLLLLLLQGAQRQRRHQRRALAAIPGTAEELLLHVKLLIRLALLRLQLARGQLLRRVAQRRRQRVSGRQRTHHVRAAAGQGVQGDHLGEGGGWGQRGVGAANAIDCRRRLEHAAVPHQVVCRDRDEAHNLQCSEQHGVRAQKR